MLVTFTLEGTTGFVGVVGSVGMSVLGAVKLILTELLTDVLSREVAVMVTGPEKLLFTFTLHVFPLSAVTRSTPDTLDVHLKPVTFALLGEADALNTG